MKTTIIVDSETGQPVAAGASKGDTAAPAGAPPYVAVDAGPAPGVDNADTAQVGPPDGAVDGGAPPTWLLDAIATAGGMTAPAPPEETNSSDLDAGPAPSTL